MNNAYLKDLEYVQQITRIWYQHQFNRDKKDNINGWWEEGKKLIKETSIKFSKRKIRKKNYTNVACSNNFEILKTS